MNNVVFKNTELQAFFEQRGYAVITLLNAEEQKDLNAYFLAQTAPQKEAFTTFVVNDYSYRKAVDEKIKLVFANQLNMLLANHKPLWGNFFSKVPHAPAMPLHADLQYVNEPAEISLNVWCPLTDTNTENGALGVVPYSHLLINQIRGTNITDSYRLHAAAIQNAYGKILELKAGEAVVYDHRLLHFSSANTTNQLRLAATLIMVPAKADLVHFYAEKEGDTTIYKYQLESVDDLLKTSFLGKPEHLQPAEVITGHKPTPLLPADFKKFEQAEETKPAPVATTPETIYNYRVRKREHQLLRKTEWHSQFLLHGYLQLKGVMPQKIIQQLKASYQKNFTTPAGMYVSHHSVTDAALNKKRSDEIFELIRAPLQELFVPFKPMISHYAAKGKGSYSVFNLHQDWSIVDEQLFGVLHCWVPLQKTDKTNGTLAVLPGSHLCFGNYRSGTCPIRFLPLESFEDEAVYLNVDAGDLILYHPALFHGSGANSSTGDRLAVVAALTVPEAPVVYYHNQSNSVTQYELTQKDLFSRLDELANGGEPEGGVIKNVTFNVLTGEEKDIIEKLKESALSQVEIG